MVFTLAIYLAIILLGSPVLATEFAGGARTGRAVEWLIANQETGGFWGNDPVTAVINTTEIAGYLKKQSIHEESLLKAESWIQSLEANNLDFTARILPFIKEESRKEELLLTVTSGQKSNGGWGITKDFEADVLDTIIVLNSLLEESEPKIRLIKGGLDYLIDSQNENGGWSYVFGGEPSTALTAEVILCLSKFISVTNLTSSSIETSLRKAGEFLVSIQQEDGTWGSAGENLINTLLAYRAVIKTLGFDFVLNAERVIETLQKSNGSWCDDPHITILAIKALNEKIQMPNADISDIKIFKTEDGEDTENYSFGAYEGLEVRVISEYDNSLVKQIQFVKDPYGNVIFSQIGDVLNWNTMYNEPGIYTIIAQLKDNESGKIIDNHEKIFVINPSCNVKNVVIMTNPQSTNLNKATTVNIESAFYFETNIDKSLMVSTSIFEEDGNLFDSYENRVEIKASEQVKTLEMGSFGPDVDSKKEYIIKTEIFEEGSKIAEGQNVFRVLPLPPSTRIDAQQNINKEVLYPGKDSITLTYKLFGEGVPEVPKRDPIDLVLILDRSGSMNGTPWSKAKEAAKIIADLILPQDRCAIIDFNTSATLRQELTSDKELLKQVIGGLGSGGGTKIDAGIARGIQVIDLVSDMDRQNVFMLLSDGGSNESSALSQANLAAEKGITIFTLGLGSVNEGLLKNIASITGGNYKYTPTSDELINMMTEIAGEIFDVSGRNILVETTVPAGSLELSEEAIEPAPISIETDKNGDKTIMWDYRQLIMGQEKYIDITFEGENLLSDTITQLTKDTRITYRDANDTPMEIRLPDVNIAVNKYKLDTKVKTDKKQYLSGEKVEMLVDSKNLTSYICNLTGKIEIVDDKDNVIEVISSEQDIKWQPNELLSHSFNWDIGDYIAGTYGVRVTFAEQDRLVSSQVENFEIIPDKDITNKVITDKIKYYPGEKVSIIDSVYNPSSNAIAKDLSIRVLIKNFQGEVVWGNENTVDEIIFGDTQTRKSLWDIEQNEPGEYTITSMVYGKDELCRNSTDIEILGTQITGYGIIGSLEVLTKKIYPTEVVDIQTKLTNSGNIDIAGAKEIVSIINPLTHEVIEKIEKNFNLKEDASSSKSIKWSHEALKTGDYLVVYNVELPNETIINIGSGYFTVTQKEDGGNLYPGSEGSGYDNEIIEMPDQKTPGILPLDLAVFIGSDKSIYTKGQTITYRVMFKNLQDIPSGEFKISAQIPDYTSIIDSAGGKVEDKIITWKIPGLLAGDTEERVYTVLVGDFEESEVIVSNTVRISSEMQLINTKDDSSTIKVMLRSDENEEVVHRAYICGYPDKTFRAENQVSRAEIAAMFTGILGLEIKEKDKIMYSDVSTEHWALESIQTVTGAGLFKGYGDNTFQPDAAITRAELVVVIAKYLDIKDVKPFKTNYCDLEGHWATNLIEEVGRYNIVEGYGDGSFRPDEKIKRSEAVTLINKMLYRGPLKIHESSFTDVKVSHWAFGHIEEAARDHVLKLDEEGNEIYIKYTGEGK